MPVSPVLPVPQLRSKRDDQNGRLGGGHEVTEQAEISLPLFRGSELAVLTRLWDLCYSCAGSDEAYEAIERIQGGDRFVQCVGERFEVLDPEWSVVQDVYGCERGRDCTDVSAQQRARFEIMLAELEAGV